MDLKLILLVTIISLTQAKYDSFIDNIIITNFYQHLNENYEVTEKCFEDIKKEYSKEIEEFRNETEKKVIPRREISIFGLGTYSTAGRKAIEEMHLIARKTYIYSFYVSEYFISKNKDMVKEYAKVVKPEIEKHYVKYLTYKKSFEDRPKKKPELFKNYEIIFNYIKRKEKIFKEIDRKFQECMKSPPRNF